MASISYRSAPDSARFRATFLQLSPFQPTDPPEAIPNVVAFDAVRAGPAPPRR
jgi:hypothetical protein